MTPRAAVPGLAMVLGMVSPAPPALPQDAAEHRAPRAGDLGPLDARSTIRFQHACESSLSRREVTLFANGTVRLREGPWEAQELYLDELGPREMTSTLGRLEGLRSSSEKPLSSPHPLTRGEWVAECSLRLELDDREPWVYRYSEHEMPPVLISSLVQIADDLADGTRVPDSAERVPAGYEPRLGDVLRTAEGERFEVLRWTADRQGLELEGLDVPMRIFVRVEHFPEAFVAVESRAAPGPADGG